MSTPATSTPPDLALVTGGSSGIGLAIAHALVSDGLTTIIVGRDKAKLDSAVAALEVAGHDVAGTATAGTAGGVAGYACDVRDRTAVRELVDAIKRAHGEPTVLVNNAGRSGGGVTADLSDELWLDIIDANLNSVFWVTREVLRSSSAIKKPTGRIINIASTGGKQGVPYGAAYSASKAGVIGFSKALAKELARTGPTVNAVCPGYVETPMAQDVRRGNARLKGLTEEQVLAEFEAKIPLGRYSTPEEVAGMVRYLLSPAAASVTAQAINVCGGLGIY